MTVRFPKCLSAAAMYVWLPTDEHAGDQVSAEDVDGDVSGCRLPQPVLSQSHSSQQSLSSASQVILLT